MNNNFLVSSNQGILILCLQGDQGIAKLINLFRLKLYLRENLKE